MIDDGSPLSLEGLKAAASAGRLGDLARRLVAERRWSSIDSLLAATESPALDLEEIASGIVALCESLAELPAVDKREASAELHDAELRAARALHRRGDKRPLTDADRSGLAAAAALLVIAGDVKRAATIYERAGDDERAGELWGSLGDLERMEACLGREQHRVGEARRLRQARAEFDALTTAGDRRAAIALGDSAGEDSADGRELMRAAQRLRDRLCRGRSVAFRLGDGRVLRVAAAPAVLGRDPEVELPLREPTVSRRHARVGLGPLGLVLEDASSRGGTALAGFPIVGAVPLGDAGEITLGAQARLRFTRLTGDRLELEGAGGLDRGLWAIVGPSPVALGRPSAEASLAVDFAGEVARLRRPASLAIKIDGRLVGPSCDLLAGDVIELPGGERWQVL